MGRMNAPIRTMEFAALLRGAGLPVPEALPAATVSGLKMDSRQVNPGDAFIALKGTKLEGPAFAAEAVRRGAAALLIESAEAAPEGGRSFASDVSGVPALTVPDLRAFTGPLFDAWNGFPSRSLEFYGITGTNGKSTTTLLMAAVLRAAGRKVVSLGTIRYEIGDEVLGSDLTTPSTDAFFGMLARGVEKGCDAVAMEVSSHALSQDRVRGIRFARALFTNLTQDHLDFHKDFEDYFAAKKKLFTEYLAEDGVGIVNLDAPYGARLLAEWKGKRLTFSRGETPDAMAADLVVLSQSLSLEGTKLRLSFHGSEFTLESRLIGSINVENLLAAAAFGLSLGLSPDVVAKGIAEVTVPGRNEVFTLPANRGFAVVDYAHTPDALERVLQSLRALTPGRLQVIFGCGGDRDRGKRPLMGAIAERLADRVILTSDNPRSESPEGILAEIRGGMHRPENARVIPDRREAIRAGLQDLGGGDCLLVAGKGHEAYQILGTERRHFSDQEEILAWARERGEGGSAWN
jgi:UDP-N-acetylmuramoyl-L-alanyl-D-glutamate--2,6-diaminopimelate ligase